MQRLYQGPVQTPHQSSHLYGLDATRNSVKILGADVSGDYLHSREPRALATQYALPAKPASMPVQQKHLSMHPSTSSEYQLRRKTPAGTLDAAYDAAGSPSDLHAAKHLIMSGPLPHLPQHTPGYQPSGLGIQNLSIHNTGQSQPLMSFYATNVSTKFFGTQSRQFAPFEGTPASLPYTFPVAATQQQNLTDPLNYSLHRAKDQYMPNVAQPPMQAPFSQYYAVAFSGSANGFNNPSFQGASWTWLQYQPYHSPPQVWNSDYGAIPVDTYPNRHPTDSVPLPNLQTHVAGPNEMLTSDLNRGGMHSFAERASRIHPSKLIVPNRCLSDVEEGTFGDVLPDGRIYHQYSKSWGSLPLATTQQALSHSYYSFTSLVAAIQDATKGISDATQPRYNLQMGNFYPEPTRKHYCRKSFNNATSGKQASKRRIFSPHQRRYSGERAETHLDKPLDILPKSAIKAHKQHQMDCKVDLNNVALLHRTCRVTPKFTGQRSGWPINLSATASNIDLVGSAKVSLKHLTRLIYESDSPWLDGMQLAGSLAYILEDFETSRKWFSQILEHDSSHSEAACNLAVVMITCGEKYEAEYFWRLALKIRPDYFDAAEQLVTLLCQEKKHKEAVKVVEYMQLALSSQSAVDLEANSKSSSNHQSSADQQHDPKQVANDTKPSSGPNEKDYDGELHSKQSRPEYMILPGEIGRMMALVHAKGNVLYGLHNQSGAAQAFEEVVLLASGIRSGSLKSLLEYIQSKLSESQGRKSSHGELLLLPPEAALMTAKICFGPSGDLPGLKGVLHPSYRKSAISCTSNSLLSLAKIYQDGVSSLSEHPQKIYRAGIHHILMLYYLSLSLQPSASTANNVGILLSSVQQTSTSSALLAPKWQDSKKNGYYLFPGVVPGSGVAWALTYYQYGLNLDAKHAHLYTNLGSLLKDIGQLALAIRMYEKAVACDGSFDIALANLANAVKDQGKTTEAITYYKRAVEVNPNFAEAVCGLANALNSICNWAGRGGVIIHDRNYDRWHVDVYGGLQDAKTLKGTSSGWIHRVCEIVETQIVAGEAWGRGILGRKYIDTIMQLLVAAKFLPRESKNSPEHPLRRLLLSWQGAKWEGARTIRLVERIIRQIGWKWYHDKWLRQKELPQSTYARPVISASLTAPTAPTVLPFHTFTFPMTARQVRLISQRNALRVSCSVLRAPWLPPTVFRPPPPPKPHLNVGYVSSDFNNHPLAHLMQSIFGMHKSNRVRAFCYATTASDKSIYRKKIEIEAPVFCDASGWSVEQLTQRIVQDEIHILVNLNGYTRGARNEVFAARPAPIQMSFMGFAGSLGAEWCDYLLSDETAIPQRALRPWRRNVDLEDLSHDENNGSANNDWVYSENIIYTRDSFFCCDHRQSSSSENLQKMTWGEEQVQRWAMRKELFPNLSDDTVIFGNFNQLYKIDPTTFRTWLRILSRVPNSILWLLRFPDVGEQHLRATATAWAGPSIASRVIFTDVAPKAVHIARACVADLFLDTPECNAHTTAADCLWSGTPILTLPRYEWKMCSRMAAGILGGALPRHTEEGRMAWKELVASSEEEYEEVAIRLGLDLKYSVEGTSGSGIGKGRLMDLRKMLWEHRWDCKLFDTKRWVNDLEMAYEEAWRRWVAGEGGDIWLKDLGS